MAEGKTVDKFLAYWNIYLQFNIFYIVFLREILLHPIDQSYWYWSPQLTIETYKKGNWLVKKKEDRKYIGKWGLHRGGRG